MSRLNKVNPDHYTMAGRLSPDDLARERMQRIPPRKGDRPLPRRRATGEPPTVAAETPVKASGAEGTPRTRKAPSARGNAARGASKMPAGRLAMRKGRAKGAGVTRRKQKKNRS